MAINKDEISDVTDAVKNIYSLANRLIQDELSREEILATVKTLTCNEKDLVPVVEKAKSLTYSEPELAYTLAWLGYEIAAQIDSQSGQALCAFQMGSIQKARGQYQSAIDYYSESLGRFQSLGHQKNIAASLTQLGALYT